MAGWGWKDGGSVGYYRVYLFRGWGLKGTVTQGFPTPKIDVVIIIDNTITPPFLSQSQHRVALDGTFI